MVNFTAKTIHVCRKKYPAEGKRFSLIGSSAFAACGDVDGHPPHIIARGREDAPHGGFEGLAPVHVSMVAQFTTFCSA